MNIVNLQALVVGVLVGTLAQILTFFQLQGSLKYSWFKNNYWVIVLMGIPISILFMYSVKNIVAAFGGQMWPSRLIGFAIGAMIFTWLSWTIFNEPLTAKTIISLFLALIILLIQLL